MAAMADSAEPSRLAASLIAGTDPIDDRAAFTAAIFSDSGRGLLMETVAALMALAEATVQVTVSFVFSLESLPSR
jgi:hypothetical protein